MTEGDKAIHLAITEAAAELGFIAIREPSEDDVKRYVIESVESLSRTSEIIDATCAFVGDDGENMYFDVNVTFAPRPERVTISFTLPTS